MRVWFVLVLAGCSHPPSSEPQPPVPAPVAPRDAGVVDAPVDRAAWEPMDPVGLVGPAAPAAPAQAGAHTKRGTFAGKTLHDLEFRGTTFAHVDFTDARFEHVTLIDVVFDHCDFGNEAEFKSSTLERVQFRSPGTAHAIAFYDSALVDVDFADLRVIAGERGPDPQHPYDELEVRGGNLRRVAIHGGAIHLMVDGASVEDLAIHDAAIDAISISDGLLRRAAFERLEPRPPSPGSAQVQAPLQFDKLTAQDVRLAQLISKGESDFDPLFRDSTLASIALVASHFSELDFRSSTISDLVLDHAVVDHLTLDTMTLQERNRWRESTIDHLIVLKSEIQDLGLDQLTISGLLELHHVHFLHLRTPKLVLAPGVKLELEAVSYTASDVLPAGR